MKSSNFGYIPALDHLRGFAALLVLYFHGAHFISHRLQFDSPYDPSNWPRAGNPLSSLFIEGHTAVSLFFVLSGFVFTVGSLHKRIEFVGFYRNRFLRTYPLFLLFLGLGVAFYPQNVSLDGLARSLLFMANSEQAFDGGPFTFVAWSIAVEWQFYLLFPLLLLGLRHFGWRLLPVLLLALLVLRTVAWWQGADMLRLSYWSLAGRLDQFLLGMLAGVYYARRFQASRRLDWQGVWGAGIVLLALYLFNQAGGGAQNNQVWILWPTLEGGAWALFLIGYLSLARHIHPGVGRALIGLGAISYSVYLVHYVVLYVFMERGWDTLLRLEDPVLTALVNVAVLIMPLVIVVASISYFSVERPFLRRRKAYVRRPESVEAS